MSALRTRPPAVAGQFYPGSVRALRAEVEALLAAADGAQGAAPPKALIVPHAGYVYSGPVAAAAYARLRAARGRIERVVLLGPAHYAERPGIAAPSVEAFETPLGPVPLDRDAIAAIAELPEVAIDDAPHAPEHSLEVHLPFLQVALGPFRLVPLAVASASAGAVARVLERLWGGPETLIVVSSDLSHYHGFAEAKRLDALTAEAIERFEGAALSGEVACGYRAIRGLLLEGKARGLTIERLDLRNSGETAGPRHEVVGYGAWALYEQRESRP